MKQALAFIAALALATAASAQGTPQYTELNPPQPTVTEDGNKIEVVEFFWYGCPHCYSIEPLVEQWKKTLPPDTVFRPFPAVFNARWGYDAAIFFTFEALGVLDKVHRPFFDAIHRDHLRTDDPKALDEWVKKQGIDPKKFNDTMKSFSVQAKTRRAAQLTAAYKIDGTPAFAVAGRYTVSAEQGQTREGMLKSVSYLVEKVRKGQ
ncbi:MAG TPA: thiol:disulfide interchange protein DsbA/DsbL [Burkholderiales bacterium]|jgi:thiol:disulfide interchange protein DsbA|nr:thiol:disulfide interchange protein DsbA/DsbL [Burkholderiales bacterium]